VLGALLLLVHNAVLPAAALHPLLSGSRRFLLTTARGSADDRAVVGCDDKGDRQQGGAP